MSQTIIESKIRKLKFAQDAMKRQLEDSRTFYGCVCQLGVNMDKTMYFRKRLIAAQNALFDAMDKPNPAEKSHKPTYDWPQLPQRPKRERKRYVEAKAEEPDNWNSNVELEPEAHVEKAAARPCFEEEVSTKDLSYTAGKEADSLNSNADIKPLAHVEKAEARPGFEEEVLTEDHSYTAGKVADNLNSSADIEPLAHVEKAEARPCFEEEVLTEDHSYTAGKKADYGKSNDAEFEPIPHLDKTDIPPKLCAMEMPSDADAVENQEDEPETIAANPRINLVTRIRTGISAINQRLRTFIRRLRRSIIDAAEESPMRNLLC